MTDAIKSFQQNQEIPFVGDVHPPSFVFGVATALVLVIGAKLVWGGAKMVLKLAAIAALLFLLSGMYFGWVRRSAGLDTSRMSSPQELIDDARKAAEAAKQRYEEQKAALKKLEESAK